MEYVGPTDKELDKMYEEIRKEEEKDRRKFLTDWKYFLQHISYNSNLAKEMLREFENRSKGFVLTYEVETSKYDEFPRISIIVFLIQIFTEGLQDLMARANFIGWCGKLQEFVEMIIQVICCYLWMMEGIG